MADFGYENLRLAEEGAFEIIAWNILASVGACLLAAAAGLYLTGGL